MNNLKNRIDKLKGFVSQISLDPEDSEMALEINGNVNLTNGNYLVNGIPVSGSDNKPIPKVGGSSTLYIDPIKGIPGGTRGDAGKPFNTISNALFAAQNNDIICLMTPITESATIASGISLHFVSTDPASVMWTGNNAGPAVSLLDGGSFTFSNLSIDGGSHPAISSVGYTNIQLRNCLLNGDTDVGYFEGCERVIVLNTKFEERLTLLDVERSDFVGGVCSDLVISGSTDATIGCPVYGVLTVSNDSYVTCAGGIILAVNASGMQSGGTLEMYFNNVLSPSEVNANADVVGLNCFFSDLTITPSPPPVQMTLLNCSVQGSLNIGNNVRLDAPELQYNAAGVTLNPGASFNTTNNYLGQSAPTVTDDESKFFKVGSVWVDVILGDVYMCVDPSTGIATWIKLN